MAVLSDIYKTRNNREMVLTPFQADIFEATLDKLKLDGVGGDDIIEETYVLQKAIAEFITSNMAKGGANGEVPIRAVEVYNNILGIEASSVSTPVEVVNNDPLPTSPLKPVKPIRKPVPIVRNIPTKSTPKNIKFRDLRPADRPFRPRSMAEVLRNRPDLIKKTQTKQRSLLSKLGFGRAEN